MAYLKVPCLNLIEHLNKFLPEEDKIIYKRLKKSAYYNIFDLDFGLTIDDRMIDDKIMLIIQFLTIAIENINQKLLVIFLLQVIIKLYYYFFLAF